jgi:hypothetical protein
MDFPTRLWNSHYLPEEVFALLLRAELEILIRQGYRWVFVASGHGAANQEQTISRLCIELQNTTPARLDHCLTICIALRSAKRRWPRDWPDTPTSWKRRS